MVGPTPVEVVEHDLPADGLQTLLGEVLGQFLIGLGCQLGEFFARGRRAQQGITASDDDGTMLGDQLVVAPGVRVHVEHRPWATRWAWSSSPAALALRMRPSPCSGSVCIGSL